MHSEPGTMLMPLFRTLLVDDDDIVREVLEIRLTSHGRLRIIGSVATGEEGILAANRLSGLDTMKSIISSLPQVRIVVLSAKQSPDQAQQAFDAGAAGYVFKPSSDIDLLDAVQAVIVGDTYASPAVRRKSGGVRGVRIPFSGAPLPASKTP
jgi:two-component system response regulator NreC